MKVVEKLERVLKIEEPLLLRFSGDRRFETRAVWSHYTELLLNVIESLSFTNVSAHAEDSLVKVHRMEFNIQSIGQQTS